MSFFDHLEPLSPLQVSLRLRPMCSFVFTRILNNDMHCNVSFHGTRVCKKLVGDHNFEVVPDNHNRWEHPLVNFWRFLPQLQRIMINYHHFSHSDIPKNNNSMVYPIFWQINTSPLDFHWIRGASSNFRGRECCIGLWSLWKLASPMNAILHCFRKDETTQ